MSIKKRVFVIVKEDLNAVSAWNEVVCVFETYRDAYDYCKKKDEECDQYYYKIRSCDFMERD